MAARTLIADRLLALVLREIEELERMAAEREMEVAAATGATDQAGAEVPDGDHATRGSAEDARRLDDGSNGGGVADGAGAADPAGPGSKRRPALKRGRSLQAGEGKASGAASGGRNASAGSAKERIEILGQLTRTFEKLLDLKRLERLATEGGPADEAETLRLRAELLARLKSLDMRRREGPTLFVGVDAEAVFGGDG